MVKLVEYVVLQHIVVVGALNAGLRLLVVLVGAERPGGIDGVVEGVAHVEALAGAVAHHQSG